MRRSTKQLLSKWISPIWTAAAGLRRLTAVAQRPHQSVAMVRWQLATWLLAVSAVSLAVGCADGPAPYVLSMSPWHRQEWLADEEYEPTQHRQLDEIRAVRDSAASMNIAEQTHWAQEMTYLLQSQQSSLMRSAAVDTLAVLAVPQADQGLAMALKDKESSVRIAGCRAWAQRGGEQAIGRLAEILGSDTDLDVRLAAARGLGRFREPAAYEALGLALDDPDPALQYRAVESLRSSTGRDLGNDLDAWRRLARGENPGPDAPPYLVRRLQEWF